MKRCLYRGLVLLLSLALLLTACGAPNTSSAQPSSRQEAMAPSAPSEGTASLPEPPDSASSLPAEAEEPESLPSVEPGEESEPAPSAPPEEDAEEEPTVTEDGWYNTKEEVAEYLHLYNRLPGNYKTKKEAQAAGWSGGNVERYTGEGTAIGGDSFGNREGLLPKAKGRRYTECDIDTLGQDSRGAKRIIFSNDGLVYYTEDHYNTFELLYGEEEG